MPSATLSHGRTIDKLPEKLFFCQPAGMPIVVEQGLGNGGGLMKRVLFGTMPRVQEKAIPATYVEIQHTGFSIATFAGKSRTGARPLSHAKSNSSSLVAGWRPVSIRVTFANVFDRLNPNPSKGLFRRSPLSTVTTSTVSMTLAGTSGVRPPATGKAKTSIGPPFRYLRSLAR